MSSCAQGQEWLKYQHEDRPKKFAASANMELKQRIITGLVLLWVDINLIHGQSKTAPPAQDKDALFRAKPDEKIAKAVDTFGFNLYHKVSKPDVNTIFSPLSAATALVMVEPGTRGKTKDELLAVLGPAKVSPNSTEKCFSDILNSLAQTKDNKLKTANSAFIQNGFSILPDYKKILEKSLKAEIKNVDFAGNGVSVMDQINSWAAKHTDNLIPELLSKPLDQGTKFAILNAILFIGKWDNQFDKSQTSKQPFYSKPNAEPKSVDMMTIKNTFRVSTENSLGVYFVELPYIGKQLNMYVLLPKDRNTPVSGLESKLDSNSFQKLLQTVKEEVIKFNFPKFKFNSDLELDDALVKLGVKQIFSSENADFSGMTDQKGIAVTTIKQVAMVEVSEEGTKAAALTIVASGGRSGLPKALEINCDHPFIFIIRDNNTGVNLFIGKVISPEF